MDSSLSRVALAVSRRVATESSALDRTPERVHRITKNRVTSLLGSLDPLPARVVMLSRRLLTSELSLLASSERSVSALSPAGTLARGFALVRSSDGSLITSPTDAPPGTLLDISLASGTLIAEAKPAP
jgi:exodeoxyribonuclease VII large subunit